jgi:hypothetical protein
MSPLTPAFHSALAAAKISDSIHRHSTAHAAAVQSECQ